MVLTRAAAYNVNVNPAHRHVRNTRRARKPSPSVATGVYLLIFAGCLLLFGANAFFNGLLAAGSARIDDLTNQLQQMENDERQTELDIAYLSSYQRIAEDAEKQLGMKASALNGMKFVALAKPAEGTAEQSFGEPDGRGGLLASLGAWVQSLGRVAASVR